MIQLKRYVNRSVFLFLLVFTKHVVAQQEIVFSSAANIYEIGGQTLILEDTASSLDASQVMNRSNAYFKPVASSVPNLGLSPSTFWLKFKVKNKTSFDHLLLEIRHATIDFLELYAYQANGVVAVQDLGEHQPFEARKYHHPNYIFDLTIPENGSVTYLLKVRSKDQITLPMYVGTPHRIFQSVLDRDLVIGIYMGIMLIMIFYNLFIYVSVRDDTYLYYVVYMVAMGVAQVSLHGYTFKYLWPDWYELSEASSFFLPCLSAIASILFVQRFLRLKRKLPRIQKVLNGIIGIFFISLLLLFSGLHFFSYQVMQLGTALACIFLLYAGIAMYRKGFRSAIYFIVGWSALLIGAFIYVFKEVDILPYNLFTVYSMPVGSALEAMLLSFALANRINILKVEKEEAQARELRERREKQDILVKQAETLKIKVDEATSELRNKNEELNEINIKMEETLQKLKATQAELVQNQKMASIGQLAAGVAHEVNNSINIINSSLDIVERDFSELQQCIDKFRSIEVAVEDVKTKLEEARDFVENEMEYAETLIEVEKAMERARRGISRTTEITQELKNFSKIDSEGFNEVQLHDDIDSMLEMLQPMLGEIQVEKVYGNLPQVKCHSQKLNQLYQNILTNAVEAIQLLPNGKDGKITIESNVMENAVWVAFVDNGVGMSPEVKEKAFDPFFTTKGVEGKGLGLANVYSTVQEHQGSIDIETEEGKGTTIRITLPIDT